MTEETFHVIEMAPGSYYLSDPAPNGRFRIASVGTPLLATRADPARGNLAQIREVFPDARFAKVVSYEVQP